MESFKLIGVDYGYTCPGISIWEGNFIHPFLSGKFSHLSIFERTKKYKDGDGLFFKEIPPDLSSVARFFFLASTVIDFIRPTDMFTFAALEDYSFNSMYGRTFTIGENTGILKGKLYESGILLKLYSPTLIKRFAKECNVKMAIEFSDGKLNKDGSPRIGAIGKNTMHEILCWKFGTRFETLWNLKKYQSPLSDIVDSYWILYLLWLDMKVHRNELEHLTDNEIYFIRKDGLFEKSFIF
jgi:hypothetical protein